MNWDVVIGLEIHVQLATKTKMFCRCSALIWNEKPNSHVCPVCLALPGALPVINKEAVRKAILAGFALGSSIDPKCFFERKHYFYPDLPKSYQISQYLKPICVGGKVKLSDGMVELERAHMEEDAGKLMHQEDSSGKYTLVDLNRAGIPLLEIVSKPVITTPAMAKEYAQKVQQLMRYAQVSEADMEKGSLRVDANISLKNSGESKLGTKVEVKNMNSFRSLERALIYETERQKDLLEKGEKITQETRGWLEDKGITVSQRSKEEAHDYRYFPDPDLPSLALSPDYLDKLEKELPEMPDQMVERLVQTYKLKMDQAALVTSDPDLARWFEEAVLAYQQTVNPGTKPQDLDPQMSKEVYNWVSNELLRLLNSSGKNLKDLSVLPAQLAEVIYLTKKGELTGSAGKKVFEEVFTKGGSVMEVVGRDGLRTVQDQGVLDSIAQKVIDENPSAVADWKSGKNAAIGFLIGAFMKAVGKPVNHDVVREVLLKRLQSS